MDEPEAAKEKSYLVLSLREGERVSIGPDVDILVGFYEGNRSTRIKVCVAAPRELEIKRLGSGGLSKPKPSPEPLARRRIIVR